MSALQSVGTAESRSRFIKKRAKCGILVLEGMEQKSDLVEIVDGHFVQRMGSESILWENFSHEDKWWPCSSMDKSLSGMRHIWLKSDSLWRRIFRSFYRSLEKQRENCKEGSEKHWCTETVNHTLCLGLRIWNDNPRRFCTLQIFINNNFQSLKKWDFICWGKSTLRCKLPKPPKGPVNDKWLSRRMYRHQSITKRTRRFCPW